MKYQVLLILQLCLCLFSELSGQEYDTIYHSNIKHTDLEFILADTNVTAFKVSKINLKIQADDTITNTIETDTFYLQRGVVPDELIYNYWYSRKYWINSMMGNKCKTFEDKMTDIPVFKLRYLKENGVYIFDNCKENISAIHKALTVFLDCLDHNEDVSMQQYALEDFEKIKDCPTQTTKFLYDLGFVTSCQGFPIPSIDSTIYFSIFDTKDTTGILNLHYYTTRKTSSEETIIQIGEDTKRSEATSRKSKLAIYNAVKVMLSPEEQIRDSMRMELIEESDLTVIEIDSLGFFKKYKRHNYYAIPSVDMVMKKSNYWHIIERID